MTTVAELLKKSREVSQKGKVRALLDEIKQKKIVSENIPESPNPSDPSGNEEPPVSESEAKGDTVIDPERIKNEILEAIRGDLKDLLPKQDSESEKQSEDSKKKEGDNPVDIAKIIGDSCKKLKIPEENHELVISRLLAGDFDIETADEQQITDNIKDTVRKFPVLSRSASYPNTTGSRSKTKEVDVTELSMSERNKLFDQELARN